MNVVELAAWAVLWFFVGRVSRDLVLPPLVDVVHVWRSGRGS